MFTVISWIIIALEAFFIAFVVYMAVKKRKISLSESAWYLIPSLLILYIIYTTDMVYTSILSGVKPSIYEFINIIDSCFDIFKPKINYTENLLLLSNTVYSVAFFIGVFMALGAFISFAINIVYYFLYSKIRIRKMLKAGCDFVIANNEDASVYMQTYSNSVLFLQEQPDKEQKKEYREKGVIYFVSELSDVALKNLFEAYVNNGKDYNIICLKEHDYTLKAVAVFKRFVANTKSENFFLHVELDYKNYKSVNESILEDSNFTAFINCFNKHELIARKFVQNYPVTKFVPSEFFDHEKAIVKEDKAINVFYVGFGKVASALFGASTINDRLVTTKAGKLTELFVNYYLYDKECCKEQSTNSSFYNDRYFSCNYENRDEYFEPIDKNVHVEYNCFDIEHKDGAQDLKLKLIESKNHFNNIIISLGSDVENIDTAIKIAMFLRQNDMENYHIFIRLKTEREEYKDFFDSGKITFFGGDANTMNHSVIVDEALTLRAKTLNRSYEEKRKAISKWTKLSSIKKLSNVYAGLNLRLKLNLLGYDLEENTSDNFDEKLNQELIARLSAQVPKEDAPYEEYLYFYTDSFNSANALSFQEKLRWNAFYLANGYALMKKSDIKVFSDQKVIKDDDNKKLHACLTTVEGLDEYHRLLAFELSKLSGKTVEEELVNTNTYKYDYAVIDVIKSFDKLSPTVIVKRK